MSGFMFDLDTKSFFFNITNDNEKGHTATVATILRQGNSVNPALSLFKMCSSNIPLTRNGLIRECTKNSKSVVKITNLLVFNRIYLDGQPLEVDSEFCMYLKEEIDPNRYQFGRIKLHYPSSLKYDDFDYSINNRAIIDAISRQLHGYAFLISKIELFDESGKINLISTLIGSNGVPYTKVFLNYKGDASKKFTQVFNEVADNYEIEAPRMRECGIPGIEVIDPSTYAEAYDYCKRKAIQIFINSLDESRAIQIQNHAVDYPYDVCDIEFQLDGKKQYVIVCFTTTNQDYFFLSNARASMMLDFEGDAFVVLVKNVLSTAPTMKVFNMNDLREMNKDLEVIRYSK